MLVIIGLNI